MDDARVVVPKEFRFSGKLVKQLPSKDTDIYAIGMSILEVTARNYILKILNPSPDGFQRDVFRSPTSPVMRPLC